MGYLSQKLFTHSYMIRCIGIIPVNIKRAINIIMLIERYWPGFGQVWSDAWSINSMASSSGNLKVRAAWSLENRRQTCLMSQHCLYRYIQERASCIMMIMLSATSFALIIFVARQKEFYRLWLQEVHQKTQNGRNNNEMLPQIIPSGLSRRKNKGEQEHGMSSVYGAVWVA